MLDEAADERDDGDSIFYNTYNAPRGNKLIRILWTNYWTNNLQEIAFDPETQNGKGKTHESI